MHNNALINVHMSYAAKAGVHRYFFPLRFASIATRCRETEMTKEGTCRAMPDNEFDWEKLYAERPAMVSVQDGGPHRAHSELLRSRRNLAGRYSELMELVVFWAFVAGLAWVPYWNGSNDYFSWGINAVLFPA